MTTQTVEQKSLSVSRLQGAAWAACNASYHQDNSKAYRTLGRVLYEQDMHERIRDLFARGDQQNALLDVLQRQNQ